MASAPKNNLEEQLQWLEGNRSSALRAGFSYARSRFDDSDGVENRCATQHVLCAESHLFNI
eukprot:2420614-Rhodomonas_salina.5